MPNHLHTDRLLSLPEDVKGAHDLSSLIFILHDVWLFDYYLRLLGPYRDRLKIAAYIPLDGKIINAADAASLAQADRVVAYTGFARAQFESAFDRLRADGDARDFPAVDVIPHGIARGKFQGEITATIPSGAYDSSLCSPGICSLPAIGP